jgi:hypothetical protein
MKCIRVKVKRSFILPSRQTVDILANDIDLVFKGYRWLVTATKSRPVPAHSSRFLQVLTDAVSA